MVFQVSQKFSPVHFGKIEVEHDNIRTLFVRADKNVLQTVDRLLRVVRHPQRGSDADCIECLLQQIGVG